MLETVKAVKYAEVCRRLFQRQQQRRASAFEVI
jgi:hypothetical protein